MFSNDVAMLDLTELVLKLLSGLKSTEQVNTNLIVNEI